MSSNYSRPNKANDPDSPFSVGADFDPESEHRVLINFRGEWCVGTLWSGEQLLEDGRAMFRPDNAPMGQPTCQWPVHLFTRPEIEIGTDEVDRTHVWDRDENVITVYLGGEETYSQDLTDEWRFDVLQWMDFVGQEWDWVEMDPVFEAIHELREENDDE